MSRRPGAVALLVCLALLAGCSRFERASDASSTTTPTSDTTPAAEAGGPAAPVTTTPAAPVGSAPPGAATEAPPTPGEPAPAAAQPDGPANAASVTDQLRVTLVADDGPDYPPAPTFRIQVSLTNESDRTRHYLLGQGRYAFLVDGEETVVWTSTDCNPTMGVYEIEGGAAPLPPGQTVDVVVEHPGGEDCRLPGGTYTLFGQFPVCPEEHVSETANPGTYRCAEGAEHMVRSAGLAVTFAP